MYRWRDGRPAWDMGPARRDVQASDGWSGPSWDTRIGPSLDVTHTERGELLGMASWPPLLLEAVRAAPFPPAPGRLNLNYNRLGDEGARVVGTALQVIGGSLKLRLSAIGLCSCDITADGFAYVVRGLRRGFEGEGLRVLNVSGNYGLGDQGIALLGGVLPSTLQVLHFGGTGCGSEGMIAVCTALPHMGESLHTLSCVNNPAIAEAGWVALGTALMNTRALRSLQLEGCTGLRCAGLVALSRGIPCASQLHLLNLHGCRIGDEGACALASVLPSCRLTEVEKTLSQLIDAVQTNIAAEAADQARREADVAAKQAAEMSRRALEATRRQAEEQLAASVQPQTSAWRRSLWKKGRRLFGKGDPETEFTPQLEAIPHGVWTEKDRERVLDQSGSACWQCDGCGSWPDWATHCADCVSALDSTGYAWLQQQSTEEVLRARQSRLVQLRQVEPEPEQVVDTAAQIRAAIDAHLPHFEQWFGAFEDARDKDERGWEKSVVLEPPPAQALAASASKTYPDIAQTFMFVAAHRRRPRTDESISEQNGVGAQHTQVDTCVDCGCNDFWAERLRTTLTSGAVWEATTYCFACGHTGDVLWRGAESEQPFQQQGACLLYQHSDVGGAVVAEMVRRRVTRRLQGANSKLKQSLHAADLLSTRQYFTKEARHRTIELGAEEDESPWVQQGDLQVQLGGNIYGNVGREALDRAIVQHAGGMVLWHPQKSALAEAEQDEQMRRALALEQRISALNMNAS